MATILLADDSSLVRTEMRSLLEGGGHTVLEARSGLEALAFFSGKSSVQLVITDVNMPEMDGLSFCQVLHAEPAFKNVPVFALTTEISLELKNAGKNAGVLLWIQKPPDSIMLLATIQKLLG